MRPQYDVDNDVRHEELYELEPRYSTVADDPQVTTQLVAKDNAIINNNPEYWPNMIDSLNTPFDHVERILLQDFNDLMFKDGGNYFKGLFNVQFKDGECGITGFTMSDPDYRGVDFPLVNCMFSSGDFFLDSFTYTPFIDYAQSG